MNRVITISRQYGSGGRELGEKLAERLGIPFYDKELVGMIAREGNMETAVLEAYDEVEPDFDNYSLRDVPPDYQIAMTQKLYAAQCRVILDLAAKGPCVMVGRCADAILPDAIRLFVYAGMEQRMERISKLHRTCPGIRWRNGSFPWTASAKPTTSTIPPRTGARWRDMISASTPEKPGWTAAWRRRWLISNM